MGLGTQAVLDIANALETLTEGDAEKSREALKDVVSRYGTEAITRLLEKAGAPGIMVKGVVAGTEFGSDLGNFIAEKGKAIKRAENCKACLCHYMIRGTFREKKIFYAPIGAGRAKCYHGGSGNIFAEGPAPELDAASDEFLENLIEIFEKPKTVWVYCDKIWTN